MQPLNKTNNLKEWELVNFCENDKYAVTSYCAVHDVAESLNLGDITKIDANQLKESLKDKEITFITHGSPCQSFSLAGKQAGGDEGSGTRSSLMWNTVYIVEELNPKFILWENVKNVLSPKHRHNFDKYINALEELGYNNYYKVLNSKDFLIPQHRERIFVLSIRKDVDNGKFKFPEPKELTLKLKDMLEQSVDDKYYLSDEQIRKIQTATYNVNNRRIQEKNYSDTLCARDYKDPKCVRVERKYGIFDTDKSKHQAGSVYDKNGLCPTLDTMQGGWRQPCIEENESRGGVVMPENTKKGYKVAHEGDGVYINRPHQKRGVVQENKIQTIKTSPDIGVVVNKEDELRVRKLTPKETWRLQGFDDESFERARNTLNNTYYKGKNKSGSQLYKQAGNSITTTVPYYILLELYWAMPYLFDDLKLVSLFSGIGAIEIALNRLYKENINKSR